MGRWNMCHLWVIMPIYRAIGWILYANCDGNGKLIHITTAQQLFCMRPRYQDLSEENFLHPKTNLIEQKNRKVGRMCLSSIKTHNSMAEELSTKASTPDLIFNFPKENLSSSQEAKHNRAEKLLSNWEFIQLEKLFDFPFLREWKTFAFISERV